MKSFIIFEHAQNLNFAREYMAENKTIQDTDLDMSCKHKNHTSLKHIGLKLACQDSSCKRPLRPSCNLVQTSVPITIMVIAEPGSAIGPAFDPSLALCICPISLWHAFMKSM